MAHPIIRLVTSLSPTCLTTPPYLAFNQDGFDDLSGVKQYRSSTTAVAPVTGTIVLSMEAKNIQPIQFSSMFKATALPKLYCDNSQSDYPYLNLHTQWPCRQLHGELHDQLPTISPLCSDYHVSKSALFTSVEELLCLHQVKLDSGTDPNEPDNDLCNSLN